MDINFGLRIKEKLNIGFSFNPGFRKNKELVWEDIVSNLYTYKYYTPAQGYSPFPFYVNLAIKAGINL
jgi:hypothetical protein